MRVGVPKEIKDSEYRVALTPAGTRELTARGHEVFVQQGAGEGSLFSDEDYVAAGAAMLPDMPSVFQEADLIVKVKEPLLEEYLRLEPRHTLFAYLHLARDKVLTDRLVESSATCLAYETVESVGGRLPLLAPMSEIAGRLAPQVGAYFLERMSGGKGKLLGGATGVKAANVVILGGGIAGTNAAFIAHGMGANTKVVNIDLEALARIERRMPGIETLHSDQMTIEREVATADVVIGSVLVSGARTPILVTEDMVMAMQKGSVVVDLSIDQGGSVATSQVTTHRNPTITVHGVIHYGVDNMAGAVPITSTLALTNATLPFILEVADKGVVAAARANASLAKGINVMEGKVTIAEVAAATGNQYFPLEYVLPIEYM